MLHKNWLVRIVLLLTLLGAAHQNAIASGPEQVRMTTNLQKELTDLFLVLSEITETRHFHQGTLTDIDLIKFGIGYNMIRRPEVLQRLPGTGANYARIPASSLQAPAERYFGRHIIRFRSIPGWTYSHGFYTGGEGDPGESGKTGIRLMRLSSRLYRDYAYYYDDQRLVSQEKATLRRVISHGKSHFIVLDYLRGG